jgi:hypothetical protein
MSVIEIDLGEATQVKSLRLSTIGIDPAFGLVAVSGETSGGQELLEGTDMMPSARFREPKVLFSFSKPADMAGWKTEGNAFSVVSVPALFTAATLNSLGAAGESATGKAVSPDFTIGPEDSYLTLDYQGGNSTSDDGPGSLAINLVDSGSGQVLEHFPVQGSHMLREGRMSVGRWRGRKVHLELIDRNTGSSYAWLGVREVVLSTK